MNTDRFDKILEKYWDDIFKDSELKTDPIGEWTGMFTKNNKMIVGYIDNKFEWFYDGNILHEHYRMLGIRNLEYNESMRKYLNKKLKLNIKNVL
jgi:hypothetical protein